MVLVLTAALAARAARAGEATPEPAAAAPRPASPADPRPREYPQWQTLAPGDHLAYNHRGVLVQRGKDVYQRRCLGCHGVSGDGKGPAAKRLITKPRDFTSGIFKFRSTDSSSLPLEADLHRTITRGLPRVSMPAFPLLPEPDKLAVIEYIKSFYPGWEERRGDRVAVFVPRAPLDLASPARVGRGRVVFVAMQCGSCHGNDGRGGSEVFTDAWGNPQRAFDFTRGRLKGGDDPEDIYRTFHAGLISVMPAFDASTLTAVTRQAFHGQAARLSPGEAEKLEPLLAQFPAAPADLGALAPAQAAELGERSSWDLVAYVMSLRVPTSTSSAVLGSRP